MTDREVALAAATLYLLAIVAGVLSIAPSVDGPNYLERAAAERGRVVRAALSQLVMGAAYVGIAVVWYPLLGVHSEWFAIGFLSFRVIAGGFAFLGALVLLLVLAVSEAYTRREGTEDREYQVIGGTLRAGRDLVNHVGMIVALSAGGVLFYSALLDGALVPQWLSWWGLAGAVLAATGSLLLLAGRVRVISASYVAMNVPMAAQEVVLAVWLLVRGI